MRKVHEPCPRSRTELSGQAAGPPGGFGARKSRPIGGAIDGVRPFASLGPNSSNGLEIHSSSGSYMAAALTDSRPAPYSVITDGRDTGPASGRSSIAIMQTAAMASMMVAAA